MPNATWQYGLTGVTAEPRQAGAERARPGRRRRELRQARADVAVVGDGLTGARAADEREARADPDVDGDVDAVEVLATTRRSCSNR